MSNEKWGNYTPEFTLGHDAEEIKNVQAILNRPRSCTDFSPAARYAVSKLCDYAKQEHELREKAETILCNERRKALAFSAEMARQERKIDDLRQQLSFMQQAPRDAGVLTMAEIEFNPCPFCGGEIDGPTSVQCNYGKKTITLGLVCAKCKTSFKFRATFTEEPRTEARHAWKRRDDNG